MKTTLFIILFFGSVGAIGATTPFQKFSSQSVEVIFSKEYEQQYLRIVEKADECYRNHEYEKALEYYKRAQILRKNDKHVIKRIRKLERKLS
ncbi:MAG: hypothetical protein V4604_02280 [Bacteroidota bacterium]